MKISELINPTDRQRECLKALRSFRFVLYGGAMGGGKSYLLRWWCVLQCVYYFVRYGVRNVRVGLFSEDYPTLIDRQISKIKFEFPGWLGKISESRTEGFNFKLCDALGGGTIAFRNLDDPSKFNSAEFASIAVEELTKNKEDVFHELRKRMRWPGIPDSDTRFLGATNPGGPGHGWVKRFWLDRDLPIEMASIAPQFAYVQSKAQDNPHLSEGYYQSLLTLPSEMAKAYAEGDWDLFAGQYFTEFRKEIHVVEPFEIPWYWKIDRGGDWGEANPCAYLWRATDPEGWEYIIGEVYGAGMKVPEQAAKIKEFEAGKSNIRKIGVLDGACFDATGRDRSIAQQFADCGVLWVASVKSGDKGRIAHGANALRTKLAYTKDASGKVIRPPKTRFFSTCKNLIRTIPTLVHDEHRPENYLGEEHAVDAWRYLEVGPSRIPEQPEETMPEQDAALFARADKEFMEAMRQ
jgi:phage terminase large subunit